MASSSSHNSQQNSETEDNMQLTLTIEHNHSEHLRVPRTNATPRHFEPLISPTEFRPGFEVSVHLCPRPLLRELKHVFPYQFENKLLGEVSMTAIIVCQKSAMDLSEFGVDSDAEKDRLLEKFVRFAQQITTIFQNNGHWADYIDPCSGLPMLTPNSTKVYSEVDGVEVLLRYRSLSAGMCKILLHPSWGAAFYPASIFTTAPSKMVLQLFQSNLDAYFESI